MNRFALVLPVVLSLILSACGGGGGYRGGQPAPVEQPGGRSSGGAEVTPYQPPSLPAETRAQPNRAVQVLMRRAEDQRASGDLAGAVATLERALRINPHSALLWNRLAHVREMQRQYGLAGDLAEKSNTLAASDNELKRDNWQLIARVRQAVGDTAGARAAESQAQRLR